jgi:hypothetical protein
LEGHITGKTVVPEVEIDVKKRDTTVTAPNPVYEVWFARDQQVMGFIFTSMSKKVLGKIASVSTTAEGWDGVANIFVAHTRTRSVNARLALATMKKGVMNITKYVTKMRALGDEVKAMGKPLKGDEMVAYILNSLDRDFDPIVSAILARVELITVSKLYS